LSDVGDSLPKIMFVDGLGVFNNASSEVHSVDLVLYGFVAFEFVSIQFFYDLLPKFDQLL
jgi:hypothetical protein